MNRFLLPDWVRRHPSYWLPDGQLDEARLRALRRNLLRFRTPHPVVSIVIPAYNEERTLLQTLSSLADQTTRHPTELIVANNNSRDRTQELLDRCGVRSVLVTDQGVAFARQAGLETARGTYLLSADADCLYPPGWVDALVNPLLDPDVSCTYGTYSFLPARSSRLSLGLYELASERAAALRRPDREFVNVLGYNFAFRRADALAVGGFNTDSGHRGDVAANGRCEDGWMAMSLLEKGRIQWVPTPDARVWTSPRRLEADGSLQQAFLKRARREVGRVISSGFKV